VKRMALAVLLLPACHAPDRPLGPDAPGSAVQVAVLTPQLNDVVVAGRAFSIALHATADGTLDGLGYTVRVIGETAVQDSGLVLFPAVADTVIGFTAALPDTFTRHIQVEIVGHALSGSTVSTSHPRLVNALHCADPAAQWCL
jgi:hypothetical protein